ncbi:MAG: type VI secretion system protein TssA [Pirellulales bacterium]
MASVAEDEMTAITSAIAGDNPAGADLREDDSHSSEFRTIRDARNEARRIERRADEEVEDAGPAMAQWQTVLELGQRALSEWTKDLEIAAYLIEALTRLEGFGGVARGFRMVRELVASFWDNLYPLPDEEGLATRVLPLTWLNGADGDGVLLGPLNRIPLTEGSSCGPFAMWQYLQATELAATADATGREDRIRQGATTRDQIDRACNETSPQFFLQLVQDIEDCQREFQALDKLLTEKCGHEHAPPSSRIRETLDNCLRAVQEIGRKRMADATITTADVGGNGAGGGISFDGSNRGAGGVSSAGGFQLSTRDDAFRILLAVADFFERSEPQSLLPAQIRRVVRWGRLTPQELFAELLDDGGALEQMFKLVGIPRPENSE